MAVLNKIIYFFPHRLTRVHDLGRVLSYSASESFGIFESPNTFYISPEDKLLQDFLSNMTLSLSNGRMSEPLTEIPILLSHSTIRASIEAIARGIHTLSNLFHEGSFSSSAGCTKDLFDDYLMEREADLMLRWGKGLPPEPCTSRNKTFAPCCSYFGRKFADNLSTVLKIMRFSAPQPSNLASSQTRKILSDMKEALQMPFTTSPNHQEQWYNRQVLFPRCTGTDGLTRSCKGFAPMLTDKRLCYTISGSGGAMETLYKKTEFMGNIFDVFGTSGSRRSRGPKSQQQFLPLREIYLYTGQSFKPSLSQFYISYSSRSPDFMVSFNGKLNPFNVRTRSVSVKPGHKTIVKVVPSLTSASEDLRPLHIKGRKCRFSNEAENMEVLLQYTQAGCEFECLLRNARHFCGCVPWNYPHPPGNVSLICDYLGNTCFDMVRTLSCEICLYSRNSNCFCKAS